MGEIPTFFNKYSMQIPRTEFAQALRALETERGLSAEVIMDTIKQAIIAAHKRDSRERGEDVEELEYEVEINPVSGEAKVFLLVDGKKSKRKDVTPPGFGRIAAQTAKQVIHQKIREAEKSSIMDEYEERIGTLVSGLILRFDGPVARIDLGRTEGIMSAEERASDERLTTNQRYTFLLKEIRETPGGKELILSRSDPEFVKKLFSREVPEINSQSVEIKAIVREAGVRTKIVVYSNQSGVDPVGSCVGQKGVRVQAVTNELGGERVDIIPWSSDPAEYIKAALSLTEDITVSLDEDTKTAKVKVPEDKLSVAIGKNGQNARLAAKLTEWKIEVESAEGKSSSKESVSEGKKEPGKKKKVKDPKVEDKKKQKGKPKADVKKE